MGNLQDELRESRRQSKKNILAASEVLSEAKKKIYIAFMNKRFENSYTHISYAEEWANRFKHDPKPYMDGLSKSIYLDLLYGSIR